MDDSVSYTELRENLKNYLDKVCADNAPLLVKRRSGEDVVIISREEFESLEETAYLLRSPANANRLHAALKEAAPKRKKYKTVGAVREKFGV